MAVGAKILVVVSDDQHQPIPCDRSSGIYDLPSRRRLHRITAGTANIDTFAELSIESTEHRARCRPLPATYSNVCGLVSLGRRGRRRCAAFRCGRCRVGRRCWCGCRGLYSGFCARAAARRRLRRGRRRSCSTLHRHHCRWHISFGQHQRLARINRVGSPNAIGRSQASKFEAVSKGNGIQRIAAEHNVTANAFARSRCAVIDDRCRRTAATTRQEAESEKENSYRPDGFNARGHPNDSRAGQQAQGQPPLKRDRAAAGYHLTLRHRPQASPAA